MFFNGAKHERRSKITVLGTCGNFSEIEMFFNYAAAAAKPEHLSGEDDSTVVFQVPKWRKHQLRVFMCVRAADTDIAGTYIYIILHLENYKIVHEY